jgi:hypothetical protein
MTLSVPDELKDEIENARGSINFSALFVAAFEEVWLEKKGNSIADENARLRQKLRRIRKEARV